MPAMSIRQEGQRADTGLRSSDETKPSFPWEILTVSQSFYTLDPELLSSSKIISPQAALTFRMALSQNREVSSDYLCNEPPGWFSEKCNQ